MTVLVNAGVYADHETDASRREDASDALETIYDGELGVPYVTDYVYDDAVTLTLKRTRSFPAVKAVGRRVRGVDPYPSVCEMLRVSSGVFTDSAELFERYDDQQISFTDATTVALCDRHDIETVLSFDEDFGELVDRIDLSTL